MPRSRCDAQHISPDAGATAADGAGAGKGPHVDIVTDTPQSWHDALLAADRVAADAALAWPPGTAINDAAAPQDVPALDVLPAWVKPYVPR